MNKVIDWAKTHPKLSMWLVPGYALTHEAHFLETAENCARYYMDNTPAHGVPPNDFSEPVPSLPYESSAAAIAASGLLQLSGLTLEPSKAKIYHEYALTILDTLSTEEFLADRTPGWEGILKHGIYHQRKGLGVDESVMWGDYFYLEALSKALEA